MERADAVVIGAGLIGSTIAWRLAQRGRRVVLLDRGEPGAESSAAAAGLLIPTAGSIDTQLLRLYLDSLTSYDAYVAELREASQAAFEYRVCGHLFLGLDDNQAQALRSRIGDQHAAGLAAEWLSGDDARRMEPAINPETRGALYFPRHAVLDNRRMSAAAARAAARAGAEVRPFEPALRIALDGGHVGGVETTRGQIATEIVVNAAGCWSSTLAPWMDEAIGPAKGEMIALQAWRPPVERIVSVPGGSVSTRGDGRIMVGATRIDGSYSKDVSVRAIQSMFDVARSAVPTLAEARFFEAWAGLRPRSRDELPVIGADSLVGLYWATGHLGMGILSAPTTADVIAGLIEGETPRISIDSFSPHRFQTSTTADASGELRGEEG